ncbi:hypothetical protein AMTRI_Chr13g118800 [Amborella trichopoda]
MNANEKLRLEDGTERVDAKCFRSLVGGLIYLTHTRPDIMFVISHVSRLMHNPTKHHVGAAKRILRYICGTSSYGLRYTHDSNFELIGYTDSDWAGSLDDTTTALSSLEAEYIAAASTACQAIWLKRLLGDLCEVQEKTTKILCDNKAAIVMTKNPIFHGRTKHIEIKHHFIRDALSKDLIEMKYCPTKEQATEVSQKHSHL